MARRLMDDCIAVLAYHNVVLPEDAGHGDASLHLPLPAFLDQIERLQRSHDVIPLSNAVHGARGPRPRAVITFDDAYRGAVTLALPELARRGLPATVFVAPALLGAPCTWWDALGETRQLSEHTRTRCLHALAGRTDAVLTEFFPRADVPPLPENYRIASEGELREFRTEHISVGSHTWAHEYFPALTAAERTQSVERVRAWLAAWDGPICTWLALPYGGGSAEIAQEIVRAGHAGTLRIEGGLWRAASSRTWVPRINIPAGISSRGLELRTSGLLK